MSGELLRTLDMIAKLPPPARPNCDEPITFEWLDESGWRDEGCPLYLYRRFQIETLDSSKLASEELVVMLYREILVPGVWGVAAYNERTPDEHLTLPAVRTRGQLERLIRALAAG